MQVYIWIKRGPVRTIFKLKKALVNIYFIFAGLYFNLKGTRADNFQTEIKGYILGYLILKRLFLEHYFQVYIQCLKWDLRGQMLKYV